MLADHEEQLDDSTGCDDRVERWYRLKEQAISAKYVATHMHGAEEESSQVGNTEVEPPLSGVRMCEWRVHRVEHGN